MGDIISFGQTSAPVSHEHWCIVEEHGRIGAITVATVTSRAEMNLLHLIVFGGAVGFEVLASAQNEPDQHAALRVISEKIMRVLRMAQTEFSGDPPGSQMG